MVRIFSSFLFLVALFLVSRYVFEPTYLYYELWWLDIPMHFLGGMGLASLTYAILTYKGKQHISFAQLFFAYFAVTVLWEVYEYTRGVIDYDELFDYVDTGKDVVVGALGVFVSYCIIKQK